MDVILYAVLAIPLLMIGIMFFSERISLSLYIFYLVFLHNTNINYGLLTISTSMLNVILFVIYYIKNKYHVHKQGLSPLKPFVLFYLSFLILIPFQSLDLATQFNNWRIDLFMNVPISLIVYYESLKNNNLYVYLKRGLVIASLFTIGYGVFLLFIPAGVNPYLMALEMLGLKEYKIDYSDDSARSMMRVFSTWTHPITYNVFLGYSLIAFYFIKDSINKLLFMILITISVVAVLTSGARTVIVCIIIVFVYIVLNHLSLKHFFLMLFFAFSITLVTINILPQFKDYAYSLIDSSHSSNQGSSLEMRLDQLEGSYESTKDILVGNGFGWTTTYLSVHGKHPKAYTFESLVYYILCNSGIIGFFVWFFYFRSLANLLFSMTLFNNNKLFVNASIIYYFSYVVITGLYATMSVFLPILFITAAILKENVKRLQV